MNDSYDVLAVNLRTYRVRLLETNKSKRSAEAICDMAVMRRGVETECFVAMPAGMYSEGDVFAVEKSEGLTC